MRTLHSLPRLAIVGAAALFGAARAANASLYGNFAGPHVIYQNVTENDTQETGPSPVVNSTPTGLFGSPLLIPAGSDDLTFPDMTFSADAADGTFEFQDGKLTFNIVPNGSADIHSLSFDEGGAWTVDGPTGDASSEATLLFNDLRITSVNGVTLTNPIIVNPTFSQSTTVQTNSANTVASNGNVTITSTGSLSSGTWDITAGFNLDAALAAANLSGQITGISVALNDQLLANTTATDGLTLATIDKKHLIVTPVTTTVPEPASLSLLFGAGLLLVRRRRSC